MRPPLDSAAATAVAERPPLHFTRGSGSAPEAALSGKVNLESLKCRCVGATFLTAAAQMRKWNPSECEGNNHAPPSRAIPATDEGIGPKDAQGLGNIP